MRSADPIPMPAANVRRDNLRRAFRTIWSRRSAAAGLAVVFLAVFLAVLAPIVSTVDPTQQNLFTRLRPPGSADGWLGTDNFGRDLLSRIIYGARTSLTVGVAAVAIAAATGTIMGLLGGTLGGLFDQALMRIIDILMAFPLILLAISIVAVLGGGIVNLTIAVGVSSIPPFARLIRGEVLKNRNREYVEAARAIGASIGRVMFHHLLPNSLSPLIVLSTLRVSTVILTEASLSFLGLGVAAPRPTWGNMIADGTKFLQTAPWISFVPGVAIVLTVLSFNLLGDGLRDALDPRLRGELTLPKQ